jgi:hypothetical protein
MHTSNKQLQQLAESLVVSYFSGVIIAWSACSNRLSCISDSVGQERDSRICNSNKFPNDANMAGISATLRTTVLRQGTD